MKKIANKSSNYQFETYIYTYCTSIIRCLHHCWIYISQAICEHLAASIRETLKPIKVYGLDRYNAKLNEKGYSTE